MIYRKILWNTVYTERMQAFYAAGKVLCMNSERYSRIYEELRAYVDGLTILDTHEHLPSYEVHRDSRDDVLSEYLTHYFSSDLISAGLPVSVMQQVRSPGEPVAEKWAKIASYWQFAQHTGYGRALTLAAQGIYGVDRIDGDSIEELNDRFVAARTAGDHYRLVLREKCKIECSILDGWCEDADSCGWKNNSNEWVFRVPTGGAD